MRLTKRVSNILKKYGIGAAARTKRKARKAEARKATFASEIWRRDQDLARRQYDSYGEYLDHQSGKLEKIVHRLKETEDEDLAEFKRRFQGCGGLSGARSVVCLGARLGTEVKALHDLGYFAVGVDLNPGPDNAWVLPGDFHEIVFPSGSVDAIYTNALDHVFDLEKVVGEVCRLLSSNGVFVVDLLPGFEEGFIPGAFESTHWQNADAFIERVCEMGGFTLEEKRDLGRRRCNRWMQFVLRGKA